VRFYTHVARVGEKLLVRGYEDGRRLKEVVDYKPYIFITSNAESDYRTLDGKSVSKLHPGSMKDTADYISEYSDVNGHGIYGVLPYVYQYINDQYPNEIEYDPNQISVVTLDIETESEGGFPNIKTANKALTAITIRRNDRAMTFGIREYRTEKDYVTYIQCRDERDMIMRFLDVWNTPDWSPDVLTGWNVEFFDMPYMINRIERMFDEKTALRLSPWSRWEKRIDPNAPRDLPPNDPDRFMRIPMGISILDYMQLYKKFTFSQQESFRLDHIAFIELGERKLDYEALGFESLDAFYKGDFQNYINYNIRDVDLVYRLDQKMKLLEQVYAIAYDGKVNYIDSLTTVGMWDVIIHNYLLSNNIVIPMKEIGDKPRQIEGAYVKDPQVGLHKWVVSFDLNSLYPHLIMQYNISPETLKGQMFEYDLAVTTKSVDMFLDGDIDRVRDEEERARIYDNIQNGLMGLGGQKHSLKLTEHLLQYETVREVLEKYNVTIAPTGCLFDKTERGFLPTLMETMYNDRSAWKKRMLEAKKMYEKDKSQKWENEIARCHNMQLAKKIQLNSAYGALSNQFFRWFDNRLAESITKAGQLSIRWMEREINKYLNKTLKTQDKDYVIAIDTDSMYVTLDGLVEKVYGPAAATMDVKQLVDFLDKTSQQILEPFIDEKYQELATYVAAYEQKMKMKREAIANKGIWTGKKHYILNVYDLEGVRYEEPKLKMQGIEAVRSSTPSSCRENIKKALTVIMNQDEPAIQKFIRDFRKEFKKLPFEDVAFPRSVRGLIKDDIRGKGGEIIQKAYDTGTLNFKPSTPIHVKGSLIYNHLIKLRKLDTRYPLIGDGEKIKFCYMLGSSPLPRTLDKNPVIATPGKLPKELNLDKYIDYDMQYEKAFVEPIKTILDAIGWKEGNDQQTLDSFF